AAASSTSTLPIDAALLTLIPWVGAWRQKLIVCVPLCEMKQTSPASPAVSSGKLHSPAPGLYSPMQLGPTSAISELIAISRSSASRRIPSSSDVSENPDVKNPI